MMRRAWARVRAWASDAAIHPLIGRPETVMHAAGMGRDDRPGHPWARGPHAPTFNAPRQLSGFPMVSPLSPASPYTQYSILDTLASSGPLVLVSSHPPLVPVSPCQHVPSAIFSPLKIADAPQSSSPLPPAAPASVHPGISSKIDASARAIPVRPKDKGRGSGNQG